MRKIQIPKLGPRLVKVLAAIVLVLAILLIFPFKTIIVPTWTLKVTDESGNPVQGIKVTEHWQHYLLESSGHEDLRQLGTDGRVSFPERTIRASLLRRFQATLSRLDETGDKARSEPYASVVVWGSKTHETAVAVYHPELLPQSEIVVHTTR
ncbi:MAG: Ig-like domain-containing protein [Pyrinomonadaceae bacterium]|nr:Ig-like domain-containing protein [Pyrinomonadaceae bacterium]